jgi:formamidopyrimidine-DNA glycosylase
LTFLILVPELPEVETTRRGISPHIQDARVLAVAVRQAKLRWPVPPEITGILPGTKLEAVQRRGKYLLLEFASGVLLIHLGMSGSLRILTQDVPPTPHDHFDLVFDNGKLLRLRDPRRFGAVLWTQDPITEHPLLKALGPEPLKADFTGSYLYQLCKSRRSAIKNLIMQSQIVVGIGNIYANEALFLAGIHPSRTGNRISAARYERLADAIVQVLKRAIQQGGTTLRDFQREDGKPGYFAQQLQVYGKVGDPCTQCGSTIQQKVIGQRSSYYCVKCQR